MLSYWRLAGSHRELRALDDFNDANVPEGDAERAYFDLVASLQQGGE